jgi:hypothetical protein
MLVEQVAGAAHALFVQNPFGAGPAKFRSVGLRRLLRLMPFGTLLKSLQVDNIPHARPHHATGRMHTAFSRKPECWRCARAESLVMQNILVIAIL